MSDDGPPQLRIDGGEDTSRRASPHPTPLTAVQQRILTHVREHGSIRSVEAGVYQHEARGTRCARYGGERATRNRGEDSIGCCAYAASDGLEAMKRLAARGLVRRGKQPGVWYAA